MSQLPTERNAVDRHRSITSSLELYGVNTPASEAEGIICGLVMAGHSDLVIDSDDSTDEIYQWLALITGNASESRQADERVLDTICQMRTHLLRALSGDDFDIQLLLPTAVDSLPVRFEGIASWCQGFLFGFLHDRDVDIDSLPNDVPEIISDIMAIAESDSSSVADNDADKSDPSDEDERALTEIEQYLRVGIQLLFEELVADQLADVTPLSDQRALH